MKNFRSFKDATVKFGRGLNIVAGENNSGKSTLLRALSFWGGVRPYLIQAGGYPTIGRHGEPDNDNWPNAIADGSLTISIGGTWEVNGRDTQLLVKYAKPSLWAKCRLISGEKSWEAIGGRQMPEEAKEIIKRAHTVFHLCPLSAVAAVQEHLLGEDQIRGKLAIEGAGSVRNFLYNGAGGLSGDTEKAKEFYNKLNESLPKSAGLFIKRIKLKSVGNGQVVLLVEMHKGDGEEVKTNLASEGSGWLRWLSVYVAISGDEGVYLLDEPDTHMHGNMKMELFKWLRDACEKDNKQIVMVTHSTQIIEKCLQHLDDKFVHVIGTKKGGKVAHCKTEDDILDLLGNMDDARREFLKKHAESEKERRELQKELEEVRLPILFAEGYTDEGPVKAAVASFLGVDKEKLDKKIKIMVIKGACVASYYVDVLKNLRKENYVFLFDRGHEEHTKAKIAKEKKLCIEIDGKPCTLEELFIKTLPEENLKDLYKKGGILTKGQQGEREVYSCSGKGKLSEYVTTEIFGKEEYKETREKLIEGLRIKEALEKLGERAPENGKNE